MNDALRRHSPRIWDTDWLVLRQLTNGIETQARRHVARGATMVDLGCGSMPYRELITGLGISYVGADIGGEADLLIDAQGRVAMEDAGADAVLSVQVLEHVRDLDAYCAEIRRLLKPEGALLLSTHGTWLYHPHPEDHRRWTRTGLAYDLETRGFEIVALEPYVGPLATTTVIRLTGFAVMLRKIPVVGRWVAKALAVVMNARAALEDMITPAQIRLDNACTYLVFARKKAIAP